MRHFGIALLLTILIGSTVEGENRALLIGVGDYALPNNDLPGIDRDIAAMKRVAGHMGFAPGQIKILADRGATSRAIKSAIENWLIKGAGPGDRILFYFSGHGSQVRDRNRDERDGRDEVLLPHDFGVGNRTLTRTLVDDEFQAYIRQMRASEIYIIVDACHSGTASKLWNKAIGTAKARIFVYPEIGDGAGHFGDAEDRTAKSNISYAAVGACQDHQLSYGDNTGGFFTQNLARGMDRAARQGTPISLRELAKIAEAGIEQRMGPKAYQPRLSGNQSLLKQNLLGKDAPNDLWTQLEKLVASASKSVQFSINKREFKIGDQISLSCRMPTDGYFHVLFVGEAKGESILLFPNRYATNHSVKKGMQVNIPEMNNNTYKLTARPPAEKILIVGLLTDRNLLSASDRAGSQIYKTLSQSWVKTMLKNQPNLLAAGKVVMKIEE